jgi:tetratricopeptide (TPR) repeat protein
VGASLAAGTASLSTTTWELSQPTSYQQDVPETLDPGSLTRWGGPELDTEWPPDPETEFYPPDVESDDLTKWLPIPEPDRPDLLELPLDESDMAEFGEMPELIDEPFSAVDVEIPVTNEALSSISRDAPPQANISLIASANNPVRGLQRRRLDVIVEDRGAAEFLLATQADHAPEVVEAVEPRETGLLTQATSEADGASARPAEAAGPERDAADLREIESGIAKFQRVVQINPRNAHAWDALGNLYKSAGSYKEALMAYEQAISNDPSKAMYHHHLGLVYACEGRTEDAIDAFQRVIEIDPDHSLAHAALGGYYRKMGLEELAQKHVGKVMKSIFDSENEYNRACLAAICGNTDQALELLRVALKNKQTYVDWILRDPDLDFIRQDPRFKQLISDYAR